jgi:hypothetical protein
MSGSPKHPRKNKPTFVRYWSEDHLLANKARRIARNAGKHAEKAVAAWEKRYPDVKKRRAG